MTFFSFSFICYQVMTYLVALLSMRTRPCLGPSTPSHAAPLAPIILLLSL